MHTLIKISLAGLILVALSACSNVDNSWNVNNSWCPPETISAKEETYTLSADALFKFDKSSLNSLLPGDKENLDKFIQSLKNRSQDIKLITVIGHTDRLGTDDYNNRLGLLRAETIKQLLIDQGISLPINVYSQGKRQPVTKDCIGKGAALEACLQPDRRIQIKVSYN